MKSLTDFVAIDFGVNAGKTTLLWLLTSEPRGAGNSNGGNTVLDCLFTLVTPLDTFWSECLRGLH